MLDSEIYGIIVALGILLAMFLVGVFCVTVNADNIRLQRKYKGDESMKEFVGKETLKGFQAILSGDLDDCPESAFFNAGTIDDVLRRAKGGKGGGQ